MSVLERIRAQRVVAILRRVDDVDRAVDRLAAAGIDLVEITLDSDGALDAIARHPGCLAGTVRTVAQVDAAVAAGAAAIVSPAFVPAVVERARELGVPAIPGALTPTEIERAWQAGASLVKLFPGRIGGPAYVGDVLQPLGDVPLIVTGGVSAENAADFLAAGAVAVAAGTSLLEPGAAERLVAAVRQGQTRVCPRVARRPERTPAPEGDPCRTGGGAGATGRVRPGSDPGVAPGHGRGGPADAPFLPLPGQRDSVTTCLNV
jgi:2-dehydro-3-deoxyphosphogluconate aldolase/(4S)-4-hydroxy-2-oxoglutarate aldolase